MNPFQVVRDFERALCDYTGAPYAVTTTSCTMALLLAVAWRLRDMEYAGASKGNDISDNTLMRCRPPIEIPKRTYVGVPYAIQEAGGRVTFRDEEWHGCYQLRPLQVWDSARWLTNGMYRGAARMFYAPGAHNAEQVTAVNDFSGATAVNDFSGAMVCVSFHWSKTLGIQQGGAILHDSPEADTWLRRARFDGRAEGVPPAEDTFPLRRAWHCYMSPETAAAGLVRLASLPRHNEPLPWGPGTTSDYPDLSQMDIFR